MAWTDPRSHADRRWTEDVALELRVEAERNPVVIRLAGTLDGSTATNLLAVVRELIDDGARDFVVRTSALEVQPDGAGALDELERLVRGCGG